MPNDFDPTQKHELYADYADEWQANIDFAETNQKVLRDGEYLPKWGTGSAQSEALGQYNLRKSWSAQFDHAPELLNIRTMELWRKNPERLFKESPYENQITEFLKNVDGGGTDMNTFMKRVTERMLVNGVDVLVDKEASMVEPVSLADEKAAPHLSSFSPLMRYDWCTDHAGKYEWVRYYMGLTGCPDETAGVIASKTFVTYTRDEVRTHTVDGDGKTTTIVSNHKMGQVPVVQVYWGHSIRDDADAIATSVMSQLSPLSQYMLELSSQGQIDLFMSVAFFVMTGISPDQAPTEVGASMIMVVKDPDGDFKPVFSDVKHITEKREWMNFISLIMLRKGKVMGLNASMEGRAQSGIQVAIESSPLHSELAATAGVLEQSDMEIVRLAVSRMEGKPIAMEDLGYSAQYNKTFTLQSTMSLIEEAKALSEVEGIREISDLMKIQFAKIVNATTAPGSDEQIAAMKKLEAFTLDDVNNEPVNSVDDE